LPFLFPRFPEKCAKKNNARESAKISLAFSLAFILQIQRFCLKKVNFSTAAPDRQQTPRPLPFYAAFYKGTIKW